MAVDFDAVYFGDDWGSQRGLQMSPAMWRRLIRPALKRMYGAVKEAGKFVMIHSCGDVDELFDELVEIGLDCFNPFQPEVMDVFRPEAPVSPQAGLPRRALHTKGRSPTALPRTSGGRRGASSRQAPTAGSSSLRPTLSRATCRWRTCSPSSTN